MRNLIIILTILTLAGCKKNYDKDIWTKNANQNSDNPRFDMTEDLRKNYLLKGTKSKKVFDLLDKPENVDTTEFGIHWTYSIGSNPGFHIDPFYLVVDFDSTGKLTETRIIEH
ncbi:hypothetical protein ACQKCH_09265 [Nubsella zeaxanthinifaciens]|uniref:hypothetical protein n=1 Tax=Nubsella zeaxanthinifaciens TaxID=392412 RepID=UPI003CFC8C54